MGNSEENMDVDDSGLKGLNVVPIRLLDPRFYHRGTVSGD